LSSIGLFFARGGGALIAASFSKRARVSLQSGEFCSFDGAAAEPRDIRFMIHCDHFSKRQRRLSISRFKARLIGRFFEAIPRADVLADVATVKPTAQIARDLLGDLCGAEFDRRIRDASVRIDYARFDDRPGRTGFQAERAGAAVIFCWTIVG
jgi:hypothetical protein